MDIRNYFSSKGKAMTSATSKDKTTSAEAEEIRGGTEDKGEKGKPISNEKE